MDPVTDWLLACVEPWTRYRALVDLLRLPADDAEVQAARCAVLVDARVRGLIDSASGWGQEPIRRHNDAGHALATLAVLAERRMSCRMASPARPLAVASSILPRMTRAITIADDSK